MPAPKHGTILFVSKEGWMGALLRHDDLKKLVDGRKGRLDERLTISWSSLDDCRDEIGNADHVVPVHDEIMDEVKRSALRYNPKAQVHDFLTGTGHKRLGEVGQWKQKLLNAVLGRGWRKKYPLRDRYPPRREP